MSRYGLNDYGVSYYGSDNPLKFDATPFTASSGVVSSHYAGINNYGTITLNWADPGGSWSQLAVVRNSYGFPINAFDGTRILTVNKGNDPTIFIDTGLVQGQYYYYSIFVYNLTQYQWTNAGNAVGLSVKNYSNTNNMYSYLPEVYKIAQPYVATSDWDNPDLYNFLSNFGFQLDLTRTVTDLLENKYDTETVYGALIPTMLNQFGLAYEPAIGLQQNRILLRNAVTLTKQKGSLRGLVGFVKAFTGWGVADPLPNASFVYNPSTDQYSLVAPSGSSSYTLASGGSVGTNTLVITVPVGTTIAVGSEILGAGIQPSTTITNVAVTTSTTYTLTLSSYLTYAAYGSYTIVPVVPNPSISGVVIGRNLMLDYNDSSFEESSGHWTSTDGTADVDQLDTFNISTVSVTTGTATLTIKPHNYDVGNRVIIQGLPYPSLNSTSPTSAITLTAVNQTAGTISYSTSASDFTSKTGYNTATGLYGTVTPYPNPWAEPTAPTLFPNKASGIGAFYNTSTSTQTINVFVGDDFPLTKGIPVVAGTTYCFSIYASSDNYTARLVTSKIKWYNRFGVYISTSSGTAVSDSATSGFTSSSRPYVSDTAPAGAYYACPGVSIASVGGSATNEHHYLSLIHI